MWYTTEINKRLIRNDPIDDIPRKSTRNHGLPTGNEAQDAWAVQPGFEKAEWAMPFASRKSLGDEIMPAAVCELEVCWLFEDRQSRAEEGSRERRTGAAQLVSFARVSSYGS
jgi:hypothetical protein